MEKMTTGTPGKLIESMNDKVAEIPCTLDQITDLQGKNKVSSVKQRSNGLALRIVGDNVPEGFEKVNNNIDLEDVYLYYFE